MAKRVSLPELVSAGGTGCRGLRAHARQGVGFLAGNDDLKCRGEPARPAMPGRLRRAYLKIARIDMVSPVLGEHAYVG